jgi:hypothetical protein
VIKSESVTMNVCKPNSACVCVSNSGLVCVMLVCVFGVLLVKEFVCVI